MGIAIVKSSLRTSLRETTRAFCVVFCARAFDGRSTGEALSRVSQKLFRESPRRAITFLDSLKFSVFCVGEHVGLQVAPSNGDPSLTKSHKPYLTLRTLNCPLIS